MVIRKEGEKDFPSVRAVNEAAFETPAEANLVELLRKKARPVISLVAENEGEIVGHIMFSPMAMGGSPEFQVMGLAPMAVVPANQRKGVGTALVKAGLEECSKQGIGAVIVLGHPGFYPRFGFNPASRFSIKTEYDVPDEVFMALEIQPGYLDGVQGVARYHPAFNEV